jgi:predicted negative regulator of RcsB-dependent stress response
MQELNEHEQWEAIKSWWQENARMVITVVVIVSIATVGFRYWQSAQNDSKQQASILYDQLLNSVFTTNASEETMTSIAAELEKNFSKSPYASNAALFEAKAAIDKEDYPLAQEKLQWVIDNAKDSNMSQIARIRLARVLLAQNQAGKALDILSKVDNDIYLPIITMVKGDIYLTKDDKMAARTAYQDALNALPADQPIRQYLQIKSDQI